jgi:hypothetical protein
LTASNSRSSVWVLPPVPERAQRAGVRVAYFDCKWAQSLVEASGQKRVEPQVRVAQWAVIWTHESAATLEHLVFRLAFEQPPLPPPPHVF